MPDACSIAPDSTGGPITGHPLGPEWVTSPGLTPYPDALAAMQARVAAIRAGTAPEQVWLVEHPPLYTAGTSAQPADLVDPERFPVFRAGRGGQWTYHGPGQRVAYVMLDLSRPHGSVPASDVRCYVHGLEAWLIAALARLDVRGERRAGRTGIWVETPGGRVQDRRDRCAHQPLGELAWRRSERRAGPGAFRRHRAVRDFGAWRDQPRGVGPGGQHGSG